MHLCKTFYLDRKFYFKLDYLHFVYISCNMLLIINCNNCIIGGLSTVFHFLFFLFPLVPDPVSYHLPNGSHYASRVLCPCLGWLLAFGVGGSLLGAHGAIYVANAQTASRQCVYDVLWWGHCRIKMWEVEEDTWEMSITESQLKGRAEVRSLKPSSVEMMPFWSIRRIMVPSTKKTVPYLSTVIPKVGEEKEGNAS